MTWGFGGGLWICGVGPDFSLSRLLFLPGSVKTMDAILTQTDAIEEIARLLVEQAEEIRPTDLSAR